MREIKVIRNSDDALVWHAYYEWHNGVELPYDVQLAVNEGIARLEFADLEPGRVSRFAAVPVRALDRLLRKLIR